MELNGLSLLVEIIEAGNLSEAARRLQVSRASVSYRLSEFERSIGQQLLRRTTRRIEPTEIGQRLYEHGRSIRNELLAARESVAQLGQHLSGRVRISLPSGYGQQVMAPALIAFKRMHPAIVLHVVLGNHIEDLLRDEVDIAVRIMAQPPENLVARDMGPVRFVACASADYAAQHPMPAHLDDLHAVPFLTSAVEGRHLHVAGHLGKTRHDVLLEPTLICANYIFLREAIRAGLGVGIVPDYMVREEVRRGEFVTTLDEWELHVFGNRMYMLYMPERHRTRAAATLIDFILEQAQQARTRVE